MRDIDSSLFHLRGQAKKERRTIPGHIADVAAEEVVQHYQLLPREQATFHGKVEGAIPGKSDRACVKGTQCQ